MAGTSAPLAEDGFGQRLSLDGDRRVAGIVVVEVQDCCDEPRTFECCFP
jgi:hypothetical protein